VAVVITIATITNVIVTTLVIIVAYLMAVQ